MSAVTELNPQELAEGYIRFYKQVHGRAPRVRYAGNQWFQVNGEVVHSTTLAEEVEHLRALSRQKQAPEMSVVQRLIAKLRGI